MTNKEKSTTHCANCGMLLSGSLECTCCSHAGCPHKMERGKYVNRDLPGIRDIGHREVCW
jgi:hypothetical protein